ncbi:pyridoxal-phosphate dependent enzyme [Kitasatospora sp. NPDC097643]|uniref:pyridoxal-phosphate dependent enzyme n=1 Tax=Kitasatospora sp. NPDC097643 TaxID=3157230 RepID=UPI0033336226
MRYESVVDAIGHTPLVRLALDLPHQVEVYGKLELQNLYGMKDRVARQAVLEARRTGALAEGAPIIESSSGTMALGLALVGAQLGHPVHIVTDPRIDPITLAKLRALGCQVHVVAAMSGAGWQSARLERLDELIRDLPGAFWPRQYSNPDNPGAYRALAEELLADLGGRIDVLVASVGSGGSLSGTARVLRQTLPDLRVIGVDCVGSVLFDQPDRPTRLQGGLGNSLVPANLDRTLIDEAHWLNDHEAFQATRELAAEQGLFAGNTSGSVYRVLKDVARRAAPGTRIVGILPDRGDRYADSVHDDAYWERHGVRALPAATAPAEVPAGTEVATWSYAAQTGAVRPRRRLLFVEANTSGTGVLALDLTRRLGLEPVLLTDNPGRYAGAAESGCEIVVCDTSTERALREVIGSRFARQELAGITTTSDFYLPVVARLARWLELLGNPPQAMADGRNKARTRELLAAAGVGQPRFAAVRSVAEAEAALDRVGLPCVVKPADDSGSNDVLLCHTAEQVRAHVAHVLAVELNVRGLPTARTALLEEFVQGPEFSVEMFGTGGTQECVGITAKTVSDGPYFVERRHLFPAVLDRTDEQALRSTVAAALDALGLELGATHTEVRLSARGPLIVEVNARLAGGMIPELIRLATGADLLEQQLRAACGQPVELAGGRTGFAGIRFLTAEREGVLAGIAGVEEAGRIGGVHRVVLTAAPGRAVRPPQNAYDRLGFVIAEGATPEAVAKSLDEAVGALTVRLDPA